MNIKKVIVLVLAVFLAAGCASTYNSDRPESVRFPRAMAGELAIKECSPLLVKLTPYQHKGTKTFGNIGRPLSEEEKMNVGRARSPHIPMVDFQFKEHVQRHATMFQAESVKYTKIGGGYDPLYAVIATVKNAKFGLARPDGVVWMEDNFFIQIFRNGMACGVWEAEPR